MYRPVHIGQAILDLSKVLIYKFCFEKMIPKWIENYVQLICMDTDS